MVGRVTKAFAKNLAGSYIHVPQTEEEVKESASNFFTAFGFPQCIGAVDGTHIPIKKPIANLVHYINRKGFHSLDVQACVDYRYCFMSTLNGLEVCMMHEFLVIHD